MINCLSTDEMIKIIVSDTGPGEKPNTKWVNAWSKAVKEKTDPETERGHGLFLVHNLTNEMSMKSNSMGGVDVHLVIYKEGSN